MGARRCAMPPTQVQTGAPKLVEGSQTDERRDAQMIAQPRLHDEMSHGLPLCDIIYSFELRFHIANLLVAPLLNAAPLLLVARLVARQSSLLLQVAGLLPSGAKQPQVDAPFPD